MKKDAKSPITAKPLRQAGQSLKDQLEELIYDKVLPYYLVAGIAWTLALTEWYKHWSGSPPNPVGYTIIALAATLVAGFQIRRQFKIAKNYKQGLHGEQAVGEYLDRLRAKGYRVIHDLPFDSWNIDHVIISTRGIFTIETKTRSKPIKGETVIAFDGKCVAISGGPKDDRPIAQACAQAQTLKVLLKEKTGFDFPVKPVVVFPGWYIESLPGSKRSDAWVLNPKSLHKWIDHEPITIPAEHVTVAASALGKYVRGYNPVTKN